MNVLMFGATGMVGRGVLRQCLAAEDVERVLCVGRTALALEHPKLQERLVSDLFDYSTLGPELQGFNACFFCLGVSSLGMSEKDYTRITYDLTLAAAKALTQRNPQMTFVYVSGASTDSTERGRVMWARVKGKTENALLNLPFKAAYMFRPGVIQPRFGLRSKTALYRLIYTVLDPVLTLMRWIWPNLIVTSETLGNAMLNVARRGTSKTVLEAKDINALAR